MELVRLEPWDLGIAAGLIILLAGLSVLSSLGIGRQFLVAAARTIIQLLLVGLVLEALFATTQPLWLLPVALFMLLVAGREVMARQKHRFHGVWGFGLGTVSMFVSAFTITFIALAVIISPEPWHQPQYAIPLLGMVLGNTMNGVAISLERLTTSATERRPVIEQRLMLGQPWTEAFSAIRIDAMRVGMIPTINGMATAGIVSLPGMMTGQILAGVAPIEAVKYQIMVMFLISAGAGFGVMAAVSLGSRRLFDPRHRLRLDRLT